MADFTMCDGTDCHLKEKCKRYTSRPNEFRQAYFLTPPIKDDECEMFWGEKAEYTLQQLKDIVKGK